jgi:hypothetical protein
MADLEEIRSRLESISDELADVALDRLREAAASGGDAAEERVITRARRAVDRAVHLLAGAEGAGEPYEYVD